MKHANQKSLRHQVPFHPNQFRGGDVDDVVSVLEYDPLDRCGRDERCPELHSEQYGLDSWGSRNDDLFQNFPF